jgi:site-specific recombinase XerD
MLISLNTKYCLKIEHISFKDINAERIRAFFNWLETERKVSISTRNQRLAAIHSFYRYAQTEYPEVLFECQRILGIPFKKTAHPSIGYLTKECLHLLLEQPNLSTKRGRRDLALITTLYDTGVRV